MTASAALFNHIESIYLLIAACGKNSRLNLWHIDMHNHLKLRKP